MTIPNIAFTHGGRFHADEVFSTALLQMCKADIKVTRGFIVPEGYKGLVYDIGGGEYDHHSADSPVRANGVKYAAFGLLWRELGERFLPAKEALRFDEHFIMPIDLDDNTGCGNQVSGIIGAFNPVWDEDADSDECFARAVALAKDILTQKLKASSSILRAKELVNKAYENSKDGIVTLDTYAPWKPSLVPHKEIHFVIYPSQRGGYCAQSVQESFTSKTLRVPFPQEWSGKEGAELEATSQIEGLLFCHAARFLVTGKTMQAVKAACTKAAELAAQG